MSVNSGQSQSGSENNAGGDGGGGQEGGGEDVLGMLEQHRQAIEQAHGATGQNANELKDLKTQSAKTQATLDSIRKALGGDDGKTEEPGDVFDKKIGHYEQLIDQYLGAAVEAERAGKPIPLTVKNAIESFTGQIEQLKLNKQLMSELTELKQKVGKASDPSVQIDQQAYSSMDSFLINGLNTVYGETDEMQPVKAQQFRSVAALVTDEVARLKKENPDIWDRIRRNPVDQQKMVRHFIQQVIPPRARQLMDDEKVRNTPLTQQDLWSAWTESGEIKDPQERAEIRNKLRIEIVSRMVGGKKSQGKQGLNNLY